MVENLSLEYVTISTADTDDNLKTSSIGGASMILSLRLLTSVK